MTSTYSLSSGFRTATACDNHMWVTVREDQIYAYPLDVCGNLAWVARELGEILINMDNKKKYRAKHTSTSPTTESLSIPS